MTVSPVRASDIRRIILQQSRRAHVGHIGSALSIADIVAALYGRLLRLDVADRNDRDRLVLSKGHAALAVYAALYLRGLLTADCLDSFCGDGSQVGVHPERGCPGIDFSTGSLGQGLSIGAGAALGARLSGSSRRVYVLLSDAECNEGSVWETVMFAAHHRLSRLTAIVDLNGRQALGHTADVLDLSPMVRRWEAFGWDAVEVDGHDVNAIVRACTRSEAEEAAPHVLIARTVLGKGVSFMEGLTRWHYMPMNDQEYLQAMAENGDGIV